MQMYWFWLKISVKFIPKGPINNIPALVQIMAWRRSGDKPLPEPMMAGLQTHICVTLPQWVGLTHWGRVTHICVSKLTTFGSDNGLSPGRRQAIIRINAGILLHQTLGTNFSEILREIYTFSFKKMHLKMSSGKCRPSCLGGLNVLRTVLVTLVVLTSICTAVKNHNALTYHETSMNSIFCLYCLYYIYIRLFSYS